jgi:hypothetical protein
LRQPPNALGGQARASDNKKHQAPRGGLLENALNAPTPLELDNFPSRERFDQTPLSTALPAFGRFCAAIARSFGASPLALASRGQRAWVDLSREALDAMADAGAPISPRFLKLIILDERRPVAWLDRALADHLERDATPQGCSGRSVTLYNVDSSTVTPERSIIGLGAGLPGGQRDWMDIEKTFGSKSFGAAFLIGHEAAHAILGRELWALIRQGCQSAGGALGAEAAAWAGAMQLNTSVGLCARQAASFTNLLEESIADAVGVWAASLMGCPDAAARCAVYRQKSALEYQTTPLIQRLPAQLASLNFEQLWSSIGDVFKKNGPMLAAEHRRGHHAQAAKRRKARSKPAAPVTPALEPTASLRHCF